LVSSDMRWVTFFIVCSLPLRAQTAGEPPAFGYVFDAEAHEIRALVGTPGAATQQRASDAAPERAAVESRQGWILQVATADAPLSFLSIGATEAVPVKDSRTAASTVVFSASGSSAVAWFAEARVAQIIGNLPTVPAVSRELTVDEAGDVRTVAVSDDGQFVALGLDSALVVFAADNSIVKRVARTARAARFVAGSHDVLFTCVDESAVWLQREDADEPEILYATDDGSPAVDAFLERNRLLIAAGTLVIRDLDSGTNTSIAIPTAKASIEPLRTAGLYRVSAAPREPVWLLDLTSSDAAIWFIPAIVPMPAEGTE
jgi:hypothetical protein